MYQDDLAYFTAMASDLENFWKGLHGFDTILSCASFNATKIVESDYKYHSPMQIFFTFHSL
jgi:hypothetical protein